MYTYIYYSLYTMAFGRHAHVVAGAEALTMMVQRHLSSPQALYRISIIWFLAWRTPVYARRKCTVGQHRRIDSSFYVTD